MNTRIMKPILTTLFGVALTAGLHAQGTAFTYQGRLNDGGSPANAAYDLEFRVFDLASGGTQQGSTVNVNDLAVSNGLFTVTLDPGGNVFPGAARWLNLAVRPGVSLGAYTNVTPRQPITASPYAITAGNVTGLAGTFSSAVTFNNAANSFSGGGAGLTALNASQLTSGTVPDGRLSGNVALLNSSPVFTGTVTAGGDVAGARLRIGSGHTLTGAAATIAGGQGNTVSASYANIGGGFANNASGSGATIGGGVGNTAAGAEATVGGGENNSATNSYSTVGGGTNNNASGAWATVGGGSDNAASDNSATVAGGALNRASSIFAAIGGGFDNTASFSGATVSGGTENAANGANGTIGGGESNTVSHTWATIGGGRQNIASRPQATVGGGGGNSANGDYASVGGGRQNIASGFAATVGGGEANTASGIDATVGGGTDNTASGLGATIPGGVLNAATNYAFAAGYRAKANHVGTFVWGGGPVLTDFASTAVNQFLIRATGGVGIGTTTPTHSLTIANSTADDVLRLIGPDSGFGEGARLNFGDGDFVYLDEYADDLLRIQANRVGIGRDAAGNNFEVEGTASKTTAGSWLANSDRRIKRDIRPLTHALEIIGRLRPVAFRYTEAYRQAHPSIEDREYYNVIAQQFAEVFPEAVKESGDKLADGDPILQVDTYPAAIHTIAAIQELKQELDEQRDANAALKQRLEKLEQLVNHKNRGAK